MRGLYSFLYIFLFLSNSLFAQVEQPKRLEIELDSEDEYFKVISAGKKGIVLYRESQERSKEGKVWEVLNYDTSLVKTFEAKFAVPFGDRYIGWEYVPDKLYLLFNRGLYQSKSLRLIEVSLQTGDTTNHDIEKLFPIELTEFYVYNNVVLMGGYVNLRPSVIYYSLSEKKMRVLPGFYSNNSELLEISIDKQLNIFSVSMLEKMPNKRLKISIKTFDFTGKLLASRDIEPKENLSFISGKSSNIVNGSHFIAGTYANKRSKYSRGIYFARLGSNEDEEVYYYNYADLENFFDYMRAKREIRVKEKIERRKIRNKKNKFNYRLVVHDIMKMDDQFIMIGEAYYPKYSSYTTNPYFGANPYNPSLSDIYRNYNFAGYKYTHAVIIAFDKNGTLIWDNSFEINDVTSFTLDQFVHPHIDEDQIVLLYNFENVIRSKIIREGIILEGKAFNDIELKFDEDIVNSNSQFGGIRKWYEDFFFAYGVQKIKNLKDKDVKLNRKVFFINKVIYQ
jgi:hypothetical protein